MADDIIDEVKRDRTNPLWYNKNFNPWGRKISDCLCRAITAAIFMKYEAVFNILADAAGDRKIGKYAYGNIGFDNSFFKVSSSICLSPAFNGCFEQVSRDIGGMTVSDFIKKSEQEHEYGIYVVSSTVDGTIGVSKHAVCVVVKNAGSYFVDTWDSSDAIVRSAVKVRKQIQEGDPLRLDLRVFLKPDAWKNRFIDTFMKLSKTYMTADTKKKTTIGNVMERLLRSDGETDKDITAKASELMQNAGIKTGLDMNIVDAVKDIAENGEEVSVENKNGDCIVIFKGRECETAGGLKCAVQHVEKPQDEPYQIYSAVDTMLFGMRSMNKLDGGTLKTLAGMSERFTEFLNKTASLMDETMLDIPIMVLNFKSNRFTAEIYIRNINPGSII